MGKPRIIIADRDENYISPLQMKFIEELNDGIELEIITDETYLRELFSRPQNAAILIIAEDLYDSSILKHGISNIFILTEEPSESLERDIVKKIFKYSSLKEIYSHIMAASTDVVIETAKPKETSVILVYSASGGAGKTTIALGVSACMAQNFKKVLYISADRMNSFRYYMNDQTPLPSGINAGIAAGSGNLYQSIRPCIRNEKFDYVPPFGATLSSLGVDYSFYENVIRSARETTDYDMIVVDTDSVPDDAKSRLLAIADKVLIVTGKTRESVYSTNLLMKSMNFRDSEKYYFISNDIFPERENAYADERIKKDFIIDENIGYIDNIDRLTLGDLGHQNDIQKISFLIV